MHTHHAIVASAATLLACSHGSGERSSVLSAQTAPADLSAVLVTVQLPPTWCDGLVSFVVKATNLTSAPIAVPLSPSTSTWIPAQLALLELPSGAQLGQIQHHDTGQPDAASLMPGDSIHKIVRFSRGSLETGRSRFFLSLSPTWDQDTQAHFDFPLDLSPTDRTCWRIAIRPVRATAASPVP